MRRIAIWLGLQFTARAGGIACSAVCLSKIASIVSVAANAKTIVAGAKRLKHLKKTKATH